MGFALSGQSVRRAVSREGSGIPSANHSRRASVVRSIPLHSNLAQVTFCTIHNTKTNLVLFPE